MNNPLYSITIGYDLHTYWATFERYDRTAEYKISYNRALDLFEYLRKGDYEQENPHLTEYGIEILFIV